MWIDLTGANIGTLQGSNLNSPGWSVFAEPGVSVPKTGPTLKGSYYSKCTGNLNCPRWLQEG